MSSKNCNARIEITTNILLIPIGYDETRRQICGTAEFVQVFQEQLVDPLHKRHCLGALDLGFVIERGKPNRRQVASLGQAQRRVRVPSGRSS